MPLCRLRLMDS